MSKPRSARERAIAANHYALLAGLPAPYPVAAKRSRKVNDPLTPTEHQIQSSLCAWWAVECRNHKLPPFSLAAIPNGGSRDAITGARMKAEGVRRGMPDLFLFARRGPYAGLAIELKRHGGVLSDDQDTVLAYLDSAGYQTVICWSVDEARAEITKYLRNIA